jgi:hypothetical protein
MSLFWGIIGFLQTIFIPGAAFCSLTLKKRIGFSRFFTLSFTYSLAFNYAIIYLFIIFKIYVKTTMIILVIAESLVLLYIYFNKREIKKDIIYDSFKKDINLSLTHIKNINIILISLIILSSLLVFLFYHKIIYTHVDAINSWDVWAISWASNIYPRTYGDYPQLTSIMMSIPYVFIGNINIQVFSILNLQFCVIPALFTLYCLRKSQYMYSVVSCAIGLVWLFAASKGIAPDIVVAIFCLISFILLQLHIIDYSNGRNEKFYLYSAFIASAVAGTLKQTGFIWCFLFIFISIYQLAEIGIKRTKIYKIILLPSLISLFFAGSWYGFNTYLVYIGLVPSRLVSIFNHPILFNGKSYFERATYCFFHYFYYSVFSFPAIKGLFDKRYFPIALTSLIFMGGWIIFLSYGSANGKLPVILACFSLGYCIEQEFKNKFLLKFLNKLYFKFNYYLSLGFKSVLSCFFTLLFIILIISFSLSNKINSFLISSGNKQVLSIGDIGLTRRIDYLEKINPQKILSCDGRLILLASIPKNYFVLCGENSNILEFGYLVLNDYGRSLINIEDLNTYFKLDYTELQYSIYINKSLL